MKINKSDFKDSMTFLWIAILFFLATVNVLFPIVMFVMKVLFYLIGSLMLILGINTLIRSLAGKDNSDNLKPEDKW